MVDWTEIHSGDLSDPCPMHRLLVRRGLYDLHIPEAMYRGSVASWALTGLHTGAMWDADDAQIDALVEWAAGEIGSENERDGRRLSEAVEAKKGSVLTQLTGFVKAYKDRWGARFVRCKLLGCEVPIRWRAVDDRLNEPVDYASHLDLLFVDPENVWGQGENRVIWWDWKLRHDPPTWDFLARWPQGLLYALGVRYGLVQVDSQWIPLAQWPACAWIDLTSHRVYQRATKTIDRETGEEITYQKGEERPESSIIRWVRYRESRAAEMARTLADRVVLYRSGVYPMTPDPVGCWLCDTRNSCSNFQQEDLSL